MHRLFQWALTGLLFTAPLAATSQTGQPPAVPQGTEQTGDGPVATKNADQARSALNAMVQALGGQAWLDIKNVERDGHFAAFYHGNPDLGTEQYYWYHQWPDHDRIEYIRENLRTPALREEFEQANRFRRE